MNRAKRQQAAIRSLLQAAGFHGALPNAEELAELRMLRIPASAVALVERYCQGIAEAAENGASAHSLNKTARLLALDVVSDLESPDNRLTDDDREQAQQIRSQQSGGVRVSGDGGHVNVEVDRGDGPTSGRDVERAPWSQ